MFEVYKALALTAALTIAILGPAFRKPPRDSFPLSTYPMFSSGKRTSDLVLTQVRGVFADGTSVPLPPQISTGNEEVIQTMGTILRESYGSPARAKTFCQRVARRVVQANDDRWSDVVEIEMARSRFDVLRYFNEGQKPIQKKTLRRCEVPRRAGEASKGHHAR